MSRLKWRECPFRVFLWSKWPKSGSVVLKLPEQGRDILQGSSSYDLIRGGGEMDRFTAASSTCVSIRDMVLKFSPQISSLRLIVSCEGESGGDYVAVTIFKLALADVGPPMPACWSRTTRWYHFFILLSHFIALVDNVRPCLVPLNLCGEECSSK